MDISSNRKDYKIINKKNMKEKNIKEYNNASWNFLEKNKELREVYTL